MPSMSRTPKPAAKSPAKGKPAKPTKSAKGKPARTKPSRGERAKQIKTAFDLTRENDSRLLPMLALAFLVPLAVFVGLGILLNHPIFFSIVAVLSALLAVVAVFGRRMQKMQYS